MSRNKLRVRQKLDYFLDFQKLINSKSNFGFSNFTPDFRNFDTREKIYT